MTAAIIQYGNTWVVTTSPILIATSIDPFGQPYADCQGNVFAQDDASGAILQFGGGSNTLVSSYPATGFYPIEYVIDNQENVFAVNPYNRQIAEWKQGAAAWTILATGQPGASLDEPWAIWVDGKDTAYICDWNYVQKTGSILKLAPGSTTPTVLISRDKGLVGPVGITMDNHGDLFVSDDYWDDVLEYKCHSTIDSAFTPTGTGKYYAVVTDMQGYSETSDSDTLKNRDVITCIIGSNDVCGHAKSNSIPVYVDTGPTIQSGLTYTILYGRSVTLEPVTRGDIATWIWTPGGSLSDSTIADPVASPTTTTVYKLDVTTALGCSDSGTVLVDVYLPLSIPNAFTPNGDGHNDVFYLLGGPSGSVIEDFAIFSRWGQRIFQEHDVPPGDPAYGWNGRINAALALPETYVYMITLKLADGTHQSYRGTVILIR